MFKKIVITLAFLIAITTVSVLAADKYKGYDIPVDIEVNGSFIKCSEKPFMLNGVTYIPLRAFADAVYGKVYWDSATANAVMLHGKHSFRFCAKVNYCIVDGVRKPCTAINYKNTLFIPVRIVSEALNYTVKWDAGYMVVKITAPNITVPENCKDRSYTYEDIIYLAKLTMLESGTQGLDMRIAVCNTIVNRVKSKEFPNTVKGVIFDTKYGTQYPPVHNAEMMSRIPSRDCFFAAKCALNGVNLVGNSMYFIMTEVAPKSWAHKNRPFYKTIGNTNFYL